MPLLLRLLLPHQIRCARRLCSTWEAPGLSYARLLSSSAVDLLRRYVLWNQWLRPSKLFETETFQLGSC